MVATKAKTKGTPKSKASATRYYQAKMASRQADALKRGRARVAKAAQEEKAKVEKDIREAYEAEKEMLRRAAERMAQAEKEQQEEWFRATRPGREAPKAKPEGSKSQRKTTTAQKQARGTKQKQKRETKKLLNQLLPNQKRRRLIRTGQHKRRKTRKRRFENPARAEQLNLQKTEGLRNSRNVDASKK